MKTLNSVRTNSMVAPVKTEEGIVLVPGVELVLLLRETQYGLRPDAKADDEPERRIDIETVRFLATGPDLMKLAVDVLGAWFTAESLAKDIEEDAFEVATPWVPDALKPTFDELRKLVRRTDEPEAASPSDKTAD